MAILPVVNIGLKGNYNTSFLGKKGCETGFCEVDDAPVAPKKAGWTKAVPLATLLAMSPLVTVPINAADVMEEGNRIELVDDMEAMEVSGAAQSAEIVGIKTFKSQTGASVVKFISTDNNTQNFERVVITESWPGNAKLGIKAGSADYELKGVSKYNYRVLGDDGKYSATMPFVRLSTSGSNEIKNKEIAQYVASMVASSRNNTGIQATVVNRNLKMEFSDSFVLKNKSKENNISNSVGFAKQLATLNATLLGTQQFDGDNGKYEFKYYSLKNDGKVGLITVKGENFPAMRVMANVTNFITLGNPELSYGFGQTVLQDSNFGMYNITDNKLLNALNVIYGDKAADQPFIKKSVTNNYSVTSSGAILEESFFE